MTARSLMTFLALSLAACSGSEPAAPPKADSDAAAHSDVKKDED